MFDTQKHTDAHTNTYEHVYIGTHQHECVDMHRHTNTQICTQTQIAMHEQACTHTLLSEVTKHMDSCNLQQ